MRLLPSLQNAGLTMYLNGGQAIRLKNHKRNT